jgi:LPLT family lysophospholipid transporter-like MFS transporter
VTLETVARCMPAGILIGVVVLIFSLQHALLPAYALLILIGILGGFFVVPLNALLQERASRPSGREMPLRYKTWVKTWRCC